LVLSLLARSLAFSLSLSLSLSLIYLRLLSPCILLVSPLFDSPLVAIYAMYLRHLVAEINCVTGISSLATWSEVYENDESLKQRAQCDFSR